MLKKTYRKKGMAVTDKIVGFLRFGDMIDVKADSSNVLKSILTLSESMRPTEQLADRSIDRRRSESTRNSAKSKSLNPVTTISVL